MKTHSKKDGGFTLVELIVVIAILAILAAVAVPAYSGYIEKANRAGDEQLLATINRAYASACLENGTDMALLNGASMPLTSEKTVDMANVKPYTASFALYYEGNQNSAFKVFKGIVFSPSLGRFCNIEDAPNISIMDKNGNFYTANGEDIANWLDGALGDKGAAELVGMVGGAVEMMVDVWGTHRNNIVSDPKFKEAVAQILGGTTYDDYMYAQCEGAAKEWLKSVYDLTDEELNAEWGSMSQDEKNIYIRDFKAANPNYTATLDANLITLVSSKNAATAAEGIIGLLSTENKSDTYNPKEAIKDNLDTTKTTDTTVGVSQSALAYGLYLSYVQRCPEDYARDNPDGPDPSTLTASNAMNRLNQAGFQEYLKTDAAKTDLESFVSALNIVGQQTPDAMAGTATEGFVANGNLEDVLAQILGK